MLFQLCITQGVNAACCHEDYGAGFPVWLSLELNFLLGESIFPRGYAVRGRGFIHTVILSAAGLS